MSFCLFLFLILCLHLCLHGFCAYQSTRTTGACPMALMVTDRTVAITTSLKFFMCITWRCSVLSLSLSLSVYVSPTLSLIPPRFLSLSLSLSLSRANVTVQMHAR